MVVRHLETEHPHIHIVYNRVNMDGKAINERNNFKRSDKIIKAIKDKYGLTYSPLKQKYEPRMPRINTTPTSEASVSRWRCRYSDII
ncbi:relaxase/mobilization nuclease domain-containing protein [Bacteroides caecimuris]|uniref:relaxase/mobilization nuclease domain-containing protein n=1 Tax=Bacteroides caecimuris TaxID=1796613 RepID=UPI0026E585A4|nr:relaxase/mobilization nuclease domain-containing protein [Bacteroides caecimuris]